MALFNSGDNEQKQRKKQTLIYNKLENTIYNLLFNLKKNIVIL